MHMFSRMGALLSVATLLTFTAPCTALPADTGNPVMLFALVSQGLTAQVKSLIAAGIDVNSSINGATPLHLAAAQGRTDMASMLIDNGAKINAKNDSNVTPLLCAVAAGKTDTAALLINKGADISIQGEDRLPLLHSAAALGNTDMVSMLLKKGANPKIKDSDNNDLLKFIDTIPGAKQKFVDSGVYDEIKAAMSKF